MESLTLKLQEVRERLEKATPGPWMESTQSFDIVAPHAPTFMKGNIRIVVGAPDVLTGDDAELIAHAPSDIAALLRVVELAIKQRNGHSLADEITMAHEDAELLRVWEKNETN